MLKLPKIKLKLLKIDQNKAKNAIKELYFWIGFFMFGFGLYIIHPAAMFLTMGLFLLWLGFPGGKEE